MTVVGREVELDKTILEQLSDPLTHLVRNSVDHGIEIAGRAGRERQAADRADHASRPRHEDGQVRIEIRDDGRGIDPQAVRAKALAMRLKTESELDRMSPRELLSLILLPGILDRPPGDRGVRPRSRHGRGQDEHRAPRRLADDRLAVRTRDCDDPADAAHAGDHPLPDR